MRLLHGPCFHEGDEAMKKLLWVVTAAALGIAIASIACGPSKDKPPLVPDNDFDQDAAAAPTSTPSPSATPAK